MTVIIAINTSAYGKKRLRRLYRSASIARNFYKKGTHHGRANADRATVV